MPPLQPVMVLCDCNCRCISSCLFFTGNDHGRECYETNEGLLHVSFKLCTQVVFLNMCNIFILQYLVLCLNAVEEEETIY